MKTREEYILKANIKYFLGYVAVVLSVCTIVTLLVWDPIFWTLLLFTMIVLSIRTKLFK